MDRENLISPDALQNRLGETDLSIICNFMYMPDENRDGHAEFEQARIPGAVFFDIDKICDQSSSLPHMIADPAQFSIQMGELGVSEKDAIVIYDGPGLFSSARIWWNLRVMGAKNVRILEGGFNRWNRENRPTDNSTPIKPDLANFVADFDAEQVVSAGQLLSLINEGEGTILDARSLARFNGEVEEPRKGLRPGHIPGSISLPFTNLISNGTLIDNKDLKEVFKPLLANGEPIITTCGSGVTAAVLSLALTCAGIQSHYLYDGSWTEWGGKEDDYPITSNKVEQDD